MIEVNEIWMTEGTQINIKVLEQFLITTLLTLFNINTLLM